LDTSAPVLATKAKRYPATVDRGELNRSMVELLLNITTLVTTCCELALLSDDPRVVAQNILRAKRSYAQALRRAGRLSFGVEDVRAFESRTIRLEIIISKLEHRCKLQSSGEGFSDQSRVPEDSRARSSPWNS